MRQLYFDQAATSFPKAPGVSEAMKRYLDEVCVNVNRGSYGLAADAELTVLETRERLKALFHFSGRPGQVILTPGATYGLNLILKGFLKPGDHVIVSGMEHNAVMRPLMELSDAGVAFSRLPADPCGRTDADALKGLVQPNTRLVLVAHASNVSGTIQPLPALASLCRSLGLPLAVDAAQTAGHLPIDFDGLGLAALCVPGHKGLRGPQGIGAVLLEKEFAGRVHPLVTGGTGSASDSERQPNYLPDRFESGTMNLPGVFGLHAALGDLASKDLAALRAREQALTGRLLGGVSSAPLRIVGPADPAEQVGVVSLDFFKLDNAEAARRLERDYGILTRCGLHCAPGAHRSLNTFPQGTVRLSFHAETPEEDIDFAAEAVRKVAEG